MVCIPAVQAQRRSKEHSRSTSALSGVGDEKSEVSQDPDHHMSLYSNGFMTSSMGNEPPSNQSNQCVRQVTDGSHGLNLWFPGYQHAKTVELQQRSSSVVTQQTTVSSIPSQPSTTGVSQHRMSSLLPVVYVSSTSRVMAAYLLMASFHLDL